MSDGSTSPTPAPGASSAHEETVQIYVKDLAGAVIPFQVPPSTSIATLQQLLALRTNLPASSLRLVFTDRHLDTPSNTLADYAIRPESTLHLSLPLRGGIAGAESSTANIADTTANATTKSTAPSTGKVAGSKPNGRKRIRCGFSMAGASGPACREPVQRIVGDCGFCGRQFCARHRLLEDHRCVGLDDCKKESHERNADKLNAERTVAIKGI